MIESLRHLDYSLFHFINQGLKNDVLDFLCPLLREKLIWIPVYILIAWYMYTVYGRRVIWLAVFAAIAILLSDQISSHLIKPYFHRLRPCNNPEIMARLIIENCGAGFSFVSSHAANHFALATFLSFFVLRKKQFVPLLYLWAATIAFSQVYVGIHFPGDVVGGAVLGVVIGGIMALLARRVVFEKF